MKAISVRKTYKTTIEAPDNDIERLKYKASKYIRGKGKEGRGRYKIIY